MLRLTVWPSSVEWIDEAEVGTESEVITEPAMAETVQEIETVLASETEMSETESSETEVPSTEASETQEMEETETETQEIETIEEETTEAETEEVIECEENMTSEYALYNGFLSTEEQEQAQKELDQIERPENYLVGDFNSQSECVLYLRSQIGLRFNYIEMNLFSSEDWSNSVQQTMVNDIFNKAMEYTGVSYEGDAIKFECKLVQPFGGQYPLGNGRYRYKIGYKIVYRTNAQQEKELRTAIQNKTAELCNGVSSEYEKIRRIYDFVCSTVSFDYVHKNNSYYGFKFTAYAAMMNHTAVCLGYATLFYRMCLEAGISSRVITSEKINHAWNIVRIGNAYYNVDSTWDAYDSPINRNYKYFLKSNAEFKGHERDAEFNTASFNAIYPMTKKSYSVPKEHQIFSGLYCTNGTWYYYEGNQIKRNFTDLVLYDGTWYYVKNGVLNWKYTGLANHDGVWYYVKNGCIDWSYTGLTRYYGTWYYVQKGILNWSYVGLMRYSGTWYYIANGCVNWNYTGLTQYYSTWYYVQNGYVNWKYTGLVKYYGTWYYVENGVLNRAYIGLTKYYGTWYYVWKGVLKWSYTGLARYYGTWYYVENGVLNWNYTGLTNFYGTWYYVENGVVNWNYTGFTDYYGTRYYVKNSVLSWDYTTFDMQRASAISDRFVISPVIVGRVLDMYGHKSSSSLSVWKWDGETTTWTFEKIDGNSNRKMKVDLTTGIGKLYYRGIYYGSVNLVTKQVIDGDSIKRFFSNYITDNGWTTRGYTWKECGGISVRIGGVESLGKFDIQRIFGCKNSIIVKYIGTNAKDRPIFKVTDEYGNPLGYVVADSTYNYFDVYDMHCVHVGASSVMP